MLIYNEVEKLLDLNYLTLENSSMKETLLVSKPAYAYYPYVVYVM